MAVLRNCTTAPTFPCRRRAPARVLIEVAAAGVNNTDINTRIGWYSKAVGDATDAGGAGGFDEVDAADAGWSGAALEFPRIQGADCCGRIADTGAGVDRSRIGERIIVRSMMRSPVGHRPFECWTFGSECDGRVRAVRRGASCGNLQGRLRLVRRGTGVDPVRVFDRREPVCTGRRSERNRCS